MDAKEVRIRIRRMVKTLPLIPVEMQAEWYGNELLEIFSPLFPHMARAEVLYLRELVEKKFGEMNLLTLVDGNLALREILGEPKPKKKKK